MSDFLFAFDYGTLGQMPMLQKRITNPAELIRGTDLYRMLRLCAIEERTCFEECSDWELFSAFSKALALLKGFPTAHLMQALLEECAGVRFPLTEACARDFWNESVAYFEEEHIALCDMLSKDTPLLRCANEGDDGYPSVLDALSLLPTACASFFEWRQGIENSVSDFSARGCREILFALPDEFSFVEPNPYLVGEALGKTRKSKEEYACLISQLFREVSTHATKLDMTVLIKVRKCTDALPMLSYTDRRVGLPRICLCTGDPLICEGTQELAVRLASKFTLALSLSAFPTVHELEAALLSAAARYPVSRIGLIAGVDLRLSRYAHSAARDRVCRIMEKSFEKK